MCVTMQGLAISESTIKRRQLRTDGYLTEKKDQWEID